MDPYLPAKVYDVAIMLLIERFIDFSANNPDRRIGRVHLESIGPREDAEHQLAYADLLLAGTQYVSESSFQSWLETGCRFAPKSGSSPAELADLVAREVFEWASSDCLSEPIYWHHMCDKCHVRGDGRQSRMGIKVFPANDLEESIGAFRTKCLQP